MMLIGKSILVIDDDAAMLRALNKVLSTEGAAVTVANRAGEAMEHLTDKLKQFDLIITDLRMPILGGRTILGAVAGAFPDVPVIIITAFGNPELKAECLHQGAAAFLEKPLDTAQILAELDRVFSPSKPGSARRARRRAASKQANASASGTHTDFFSGP
jgi:DNA-binding NtrC family response regulator